MPFFSETAAAALAGRTLRLAWLVRLGFASEEIRVWLGNGKLIAGGEEWSGLGELGAISGLEMPLGGTAPVTTLTLSGVEPELLAKAREASAEAKGRPAIISMQFFDEAWQVLDAPYAIMTGIMDQMSVQATGPTVRTIEMTVEWLFTRKSIPPFAMLSNRDQKALHPGDRGLEYVAAMQNKTTEWPQF
ncbi:MAG: hypothetical protein DI537_23720 [Stutzerimonas stutzeri]|nr:MAG: hypothetical protein DI537_23720 [Stutzerimonas stutzeri]